MRGFVNTKVQNLFTNPENCFNLFVCLRKTIKINMEELLLIMCSYT